jgi:C4-dicarboxylate-specific signal transduction histidine kinase
VNLDTQTPGIRMIQSERLAVIGKMAACVAHEINNLWA